MRFLLICFFFVISCHLFSQGFRLRGVIRNEQTRLPIENVNLKVQKSTLGSATDKEGRFILSLDRIPCIVTISCIGYHQISLEIADIVNKTVEIYLSPKVQELDAVTISDHKATVLYKDEDFSVLDYEILEENLLLIVFRYQLKRAELVLLTRDGDTLDVSKAPEVPALELFKDVFGNVHYLSRKGKAYQCYYNPALGKLMFPYACPSDSLKTIMGQFLFSMNDRLYFQENNPDRFTTRIGFYSKDQGKRYARNIHDAKAASQYYDDKRFENPFPWSRDTASLDASSHFRELFFKPKSTATLVKIGRHRIAVFNFTEDNLEMLDANGVIIREIPIDFHKEDTLTFLGAIAQSLFPTNSWKWGKEIIVDDPFENVYAVFKKTGMIQLQKVNLETGKLISGVELPFPNPEKIRIYKGSVYFLYKGTGENEKKKLFRMPL